MDLDGGSEARAHAPRPGSGRRPKYVTPVDELDNSDVESAQVRTLPFKHDGESRSSVHGCLQCLAPCSPQAARKFAVRHGMRVCSGCHCVEWMMHNLHSLWILVTEGQQKDWPMEEW